MFKKSSAPTSPAATSPPPVQGREGLAGSIRRTTTQRNSVIDVLADGKTLFTTEDGSTYIGPFKEHKFHGLGELRWADGVTWYKGEYVEGAMQGKGTLHTKAGTYEGDFANNKMHGQGSFAYADGSKYLGAFENGERSGQGQLTYADGSKYVGTFKVQWGVGRG